MRILLLTSTSLRHFALASRLSALDEVTMVAETRRQPVAGGPAMREYLGRMDRAEAEVFGAVTLRSNVTVLPFGTLATLHVRAQDFARIVVFGASWIRPPLVHDLVKAGAVNLHAGMAPEYRGSACTFWADYDGHPELVGCTIHRLAPGLDDGDVIARMPAPDDDDPWRRSMRGLADAFHRLTEILPLPVDVAIAQDRTREIRYSRHADFTETVCEEYLARRAGAVHAPHGCAR